MIYHCLHHVTLCLIFVGEAIILPLFGKATEFITSRLVISLVYFSITWLKGKGKTLENQTFSIFSSKSF